MDDFPPENFAVTSSRSRARTMTDINTTAFAASPSDVVSDPRASIDTATTWWQAAATANFITPSSEDISSPHTSMAMATSASSSNASSGTATRAATDSFNLSSIIFDPAAATATAIDFKTRLEDLPLELYEIIKDMAFGSYSVPIECDLRDRSNRAQHTIHLKLLQLDHATRAQNAAVYYGPRTFTLWGKTYQESLEGWLKSMPREHIALIGGIKYRSHISIFEGPWMGVKLQIKQDRIKVIGRRVRAKWGSEVAAKVKVDVVVD